MAEQSPAKKVKCQVKGFLSEVSPIKNTKAPYFDAILQHEGERSKIVSFRPEDHMHFHNAESTRSKMSCVRNLREAFKQTKSAGPRDLQVSELLNRDSKPNKVNINVKIIQEVCKGNYVVWDGRYLPKTNYIVADTTGSISLTVWCECNIIVGDWYNITNVSVKEFRGKTTLSTTRNTQILKIPSRGTAAASEVPTQTIKCDINGANIKSVVVCPHSHELKAVTSSESTVYCLSCNTYYKTTAIVSKFSGHLNLKAESGKVVRARIEDELIKSVVKVEDASSPQDIIQRLIELPPMQITIRESNIVKVENVPNNTEIKAEAEAEIPIKMEPVEESDDLCSPPDHGVLFSSQSRKRPSTD
ncbi:uncharacterized protein si:dkey-249d8.1 isoform X2 [Danio aesculapii]|uniref:uncharacterized protein si:dkey-249d8.1 isoform X2 n=1 Tax=Danio aesculapii TaxID=1142201 RepID=UPI0024BFEBC2|nr:uncharacterized protein si:dkey-249d8.1 isoform X2 [Danio aesculapii]